tara:strand:- start:337 stop:639 length:303 start_codon:yes stop_codon:yes gene_type:complete
MFGNLKKNYLLLIYTFLLLYFFFNLLGGERGLISFIEKKNYLKTLKFEEETLSKNIDTLEFKISLLTNNLDLDYIEMLIREKFLFGKKEEILFITKNEND